MTHPHSIQKDYSAAHVKYWLAWSCTNSQSSCEFMSASPYVYTNFLDKGFCYIPCAAITFDNLCLSLASAGFVGMCHHAKFIWHFIQLFMHINSGATSTFWLMWIMLLQIKFLRMSIIFRNCHIHFHSGHINLFIHWQSPVTFLASMPVVVTFCFYNTHTHTYTLSILMGMKNNMAFICISLVNWMVEHFFKICLFSWRSLYSCLLPIFLNQFFVNEM